MNEKHIVGAFDCDLENIHTAVMKMGGFGEEALSNAATALETRDMALAKKVRGGDRVIDALDQSIKSDTARLLALRAPTARDLRTVLSVIEISSHLERCGDYAKNISKRTVTMARDGEIAKALPALRRMSGFVENMIKDALDAYATQDDAKAEEIIERDQEADEIYNTLFRFLLTHMMEDHRNITAGMHLHFIAKNIERVGDHATGIAEQTIYLVTGKFPDEERPKRDHTSFKIQKSDA